MLLVKKIAYCKKKKFKKINTIYIFIYKIKGRASQRGSFGDS